MPMSIQQDNANPLPLRQSPHGIGTLMVRFAGLLAIAVVLMTLVWSR